MEKIYNQLSEQFNSVSAYDNDVMQSIMHQLEDSGKAIFEINLESLDLVELIQYNTDVDIDYTLLSEDENLYQIKLYL